ncbi:uncharacterized protein HKW66_Vig0036460 [Vigna angularis]|uniref:Uncharacterized protein n=1 Tax=Phaseolus angularis TaxID=3914 RepID=A0A8T0LA23_PHAAN|nr:uncharacterized protein HKW66_Vig0036460 [Vigna angularis]
MQDSEDSSNCSWEKEQRISGRRAIYIEHIQHHFKKHFTIRVFLLPRGTFH